MMQWWILDSYQITLKWLDNRFLLTNNNLVILCYDSDKLGRLLLGERGNLSLPRMKMRMSNKARMRINKLNMNKLSLSALDEMDK